MTVADATCAWLDAVISESSHQLVVPAGQGNRETLEREQGEALLAGLDHLDVTLGYVSL